jgi:L-2-hydroxyglutarate oxidase
MSRVNRTIIVVGGGIVGLATALRIQEDRPDLNLVVLEKEQHIAQHQTGNNSGVIHSGLYYKPGSLKALNCRSGYQQLLDFCQNENIPHEICGKLVVATSENELPRLEELYRRGIGNGLEGLTFLEPDAIREIEPHCTGLRALWVPQAGIVDYSQVAARYGEKLRNLGAEIVLGDAVQAIRQGSNQVDVISLSGCRSGQAVVVCAGLQSDRLARQTLPDLPLRILPFRGEYYTLKPEACNLVRHLIYPVPDPAFPFLGVHFTRMIGGGIECGPNAVLALGREAYRKTDFNLSDTWEILTWPGFRKVASRYWQAGLGEYYRSMSKSAFVRALQKLIPEVQAEHLNPGGAGIRAQACDRDGNLLDDFDIRVDGKVVYVCNAPSPAATASLAIGNTLSKYALSLFN